LRTKHSSDVETPPLPPQGFENKHSTDGETPPPLPPQGFENKHSTDVDTPPHPHRVCISIVPQGEPYSDVVRVLVLYDPPVRGKSGVSLVDPMGAEAIKKGGDGAEVDPAVAQAERQGAYTRSLLIWTVTVSVSPRSSLLSPLSSPLCSFLAPLRPFLSSSPSSLLPPLRLKVTAQCI
jgi:hypothetical protein